MQLFFNLSQVLASLRLKMENISPKILSILDKTVFYTMAMINTLKNKYLFGLVLVGGGLGIYFEKYNLFIETLFIFIGLDTILGVWLAIKRKNFDPRKLLGCVEKTVVYFIYLIVTYMLAELKGGDLVIIMGYIHYLMLVLMILVEAKSVLVRGNEVHPNVVFTPIVKILEKIEINTQAKYMNQLEKNTQNT